jgi:LemA protein
MWLWIVIGLLVLLLLWVAFTFNQLIRRRNRVEEAWAQIDVELTRRYDVVPAIVGAVSGYMEHERELLQRVAEARSAAVGAGNVQSRAAADSALTGALRSLFLVAEQYPTLRASDNVLELQEQLAHTEDRIAYARGYYNAAVVEYESARLTVPSNFVASVLRFTLRQPFVADVSSRGPVEVDLTGSQGRTVADAS